MKNYRIADLSVNMEVGGRTLYQSEKYKVSDTPDDMADITVANLSESINLILKKHPQAVWDTVEYLLSGLRFYKALVDFDGFMLHSSAVVYEGKAYLFSADSGVGKSTHTSLWLQRFPGSFILNDDKPALRIINGTTYVYGTPWNGKGERNVNTCVPLGGICFIYRAQQNTIRPMPTPQVIQNLLRQTAHGKFSEQIMTKLFLIWNQVLADHKVYEMGCLPNIEAAELAYQTMKGN